MFQIRLDPGRVAVADPHHFNAEPDPSFHYNADPDPDPVFITKWCQSATIILQTLYLEPPHLHCKRPWSSIAPFRASNETRKLLNFDFDEDLDLAFTPMQIRICIKLSKIMWFLADSEPWDPGFYSVCESGTDTQSGFTKIRLLQRGTFDSWELYYL
jgi:hypothetical protein